MQRNLLDQTSLFCYFLFVGLSPNIILATIIKIGLNFPKNFSIYITCKLQNLFEKFISNFDNCASKAYLAIDQSFRVFPPEKRGGIDESGKFRAKSTEFDD